MLFIFKIFYFLIFIFVSYGLNAQELKIQENYFYHQLVALNKKNNLNIIMSDQDIKKYKNIFDLQKEGKWKKAKNIIDTLDNDILLGHVKYQKLMHPTKYRSPYIELKDWLEEYSDHPMAIRIWKLAERRKPEGSKPLFKPKILERLSGYGMDKNNVIPFKDFNIAKKYYKHYAKIRNLVKRGRPTQALRFLNNTEDLPQVIYDDLRGIISAGYFSVGKDKSSFKLAIHSASRSGDVNPILYWRAGLAAYRLNNKDIALKNFYKLTDLKVNHWLKSAGAFWVAKINKENNNLEEIDKYLLIASKQSDTFYGQLAIEILGLKDPINWKLNNPGEIFKMDIFKNIHLKRAIALSVVGRYGEADQEIRFLYSKFKENKLEEMLELTNFLSLPAVQIRIGDKLEQRGKKSYVALYPKPNWLSSNDLIIDEALLWALIRKESSFYLKAKSNRGARGLMQLMPSTARMVMKDRTIRGANRWKLYDLQYNILTGQKLLERLLATENISDSLIAILISWNAGPSRYEQWNKKNGQYKDPLLYIESIPSYETRWFVKEVLKNLWIYRDYLGQEKFSRNQIVQDDWPKYKNLNFKE